MPLEQPDGLFRHNKFSYLRKSDPIAEASLRYGAGFRIFLLTTALFFEPLAVFDADAINPAGYLIN